MANSENNFWQEIQKEIAENVPETVPTIAQTQGVNQSPPDAIGNSYASENYRLPFNNGGQMPNNQANTPTPESLINAQVPFDTDNILSILKNNIGYYAVCDFLIGTGSLDTREGILYASGVNYLTLYHPQNETYTVCDIYSLKFITFYNTTTVPPQRNGGRTSAVRTSTGTNSKNSRRFY